MKKKIAPSDLKREADRLIAENRMPPLEALLQAIAETREKYREQILEARNNEDPRS